jgi:cysteine synthase
VVYNFNKLLEEIMNIAQNVTEIIGNTPLVRLNKIAAGMHGEVVAKLESLNPAVSVKDRIALAMIDDAEKAGRITPGVTTLVEPTSGNTGIGLALVAAVRGYKLILTMPETMSLERRTVLLALGAKLEITPAAGRIGASIERAKQLLTEIPDSVMLDQFGNPSNPAVHFRTTGPELWRDTDGKIDVLISGVGTGGTLTGTGGFLKTQNPNIKIVAVEPAESAVLSGGQPGPHKIQGIGTGFVPAVLDTKLIDEVIQVSSDEALVMARRIPLEEGLLVGISAGAAVHAALKVAARPEMAGKRIAVIIPSYGERYLSSALFEPYREAAQNMQVTVV